MEITALLLGGGSALLLNAPYYYWMHRGQAGRVICARAVANSDNSFDLELLCAYDDHGVERSATCTYRSDISKGSLRSWLAQFPEGTAVRVSWDLEQTIVTRPGFETWCNAACLAFLGILLICIGGLVEYGGNIPLQPALNFTRLLALSAVTLYAVVFSLRTIFRYRRFDDLVVGAPDPDWRPERSTRPEDRT